jgi:hypothetical protein
VTPAKPYKPESFAALVAAIQEGGEREIERAVQAIEREIKSTTRRKPAVRKSSCPNRPSR